MASISVIRVLGQLALQSMTSGCTLPPARRSVPPPAACHPAQPLHCCCAFPARSRGAGSPANSKLAPCAGLTDPPVDGCGHHLGPLEPPPWALTEASCQSKQHPAPALALGMEMPVLLQGFEA